MYWLAVSVLIFLAVRTAVTLANWFSWPKLPHSEEKHEEMVSILIPARNEAHNIGKTIQLIEVQDYQNYELLILDDNSDDGTAEVVGKAMADNPKIKLLNGEALPKGWLGKNWACHQLSKKATGDYFLFIDADVIVKPRLITSALSEVKKRKLILLSIFPDQELKTWGEKVAVPIMHYLLLTLLPLHFVRKMPQASFAAANGQFMLFNAEEYHKYSFHEQVKAQITEDIETVRFIKQQGQKAGTYLGNRLVLCRMYNGYNEVLDGFSKNLLAGFGNSILGLLIFLFLTTAGYLSFAWLPIPLFGLGLCLILVKQIALARLSNQAIWETILLHPLKMITFSVIAFKSISRKIRRKNNWKGRNVEI